ncbi:group III truncated hemoglobin [Flavobacterium sp. SM2513]|uniref:group III truncated hemoglobin n=1 Tax=Flavobacterium sp. SM2513 TaxID=3424766 RepID=UPI003D7F9717
MRKNIQTREDVTLLVHSFYAKIRKDAEIGHFFNDTIKDWDEHLEKLTDFWEMNLFGTRNFTGNPIETHIEFDRKFNGVISSHEFGIWLNHWFATIDELFEGENADILKRRARKMSTMLFMNMFNSRG